MCIRDRPRRVSVKAFNHALGRSVLSFFCAPGLKARIKGEFPACLDGLPMLVPGASSSVRRQLDDWFARQSIAPVVVGEFDDAALMKAFGREGQGVFMAPRAVSYTHLDVYKRQAMSCVGSGSLALARGAASSTATMMSATVMASVRCPSV